jgi:hypothetical protein
MSARLLPLAKAALAALTTSMLTACNPAPGVQAVATAPERGTSAHVPLPAAQADTASTAALQALADRVALLERERLQPAAQAASTAGVHAPRVPTEAELRAGPTGAGEQRDTQQLERERQAELDGLFRQETVNTAWASITSAVVRQALPAPADGSALALRSVECRSQSCRVEVGAAGADAMRQALPQLAQRLAERFPSMAVVSRSDGTGATLYFRS